MRDQGVGGLSDVQQSELLNQWLERERQERVRAKTPSNWLNHN